MSVKDDSKGAKPQDAFATEAAPAPEPLDDQACAYLTVIAGPEMGQRFRLVEHQSIVLGRPNVQGVDVPLADDGISRQHARVKRMVEEVRIEDLGSKNGTFVGGERIAERVLEHGDNIQLGASTILRFSFSSTVEDLYERRLLESALRDPLTRLYNRRFFDERLVAELAAARRHGHKISLLMLDLDHFKKINDVHGHSAGDQALKMVARCLERSIRQEDLAARLGGEEFVVLARHTPLAGARLLAERIRKSIETSSCFYNNQHLAVTVSIGIATSVGAEGTEEDVDPKALFDRADRALYLAKQAGRNRVEVVPEG